MAQVSHGTRRHEAVERAGIRVRRKPKEAFKSRRRAVQDGGDKRCGVLFLDVEGDSPCVNLVLQDIMEVLRRVRPVVDVPRVQELAYNEQELRW